MIKNFNDHAANERTYLAWLRTAIAIIAFGFLIERFDIFLRTIYDKLDGVDSSKLSGSTSGEVLGLCLVLIGLIVMGVATRRFVLLRRKIESETVESLGPRTDVSLGILLTLMGLFVFAYIIHLLIG